MLGGMAELGDESSAMHERVGEAAARYGVQLLLIGGRYAEELERGARAGGLAPENIVRFACNDEAASCLQARLRPGDLVLCLGAGDITAVAGELLAALSARAAKERS